MNQHIYVLLIFNGECFISLMVSPNDEKFQFINFFSRIVAAFYASLRNLSLTKVTKIFCFLIRFRALAFIFSFYIHDNEYRIHE